MIILGINAFHGDVSAALLEDGKLLMAVEEERFTRVKHWSGFPEQSIRACLDFRGLALEDVDLVAISRDPRANMARKVQFVLTKRPVWGLVRDRLRNRAFVSDLPQELAKRFGAASPPVTYVEHHLAHLASAYLASPFQESAIAAIDGFGDFVSTSCGLGKGSSLSISDRVFFPHSLGIFYTAVTQYLGFENFGDEYKVMGMAPYGKPSMVAELQEMVNLRPKGRFELDLELYKHWNEDIEMEWSEGYPSLGTVYSPALEDVLGIPARGKDEELSQVHLDLAASAQVVFEGAAWHFLNYVHERHPSENLCLAGGCAMNSVANGKIRANTPFKKLYVQPAAADNGTSLGAALYAWNVIQGNDKRFVQDHGSWGTSYPDATGVEFLPSDKPDEFQWTEFENDAQLCDAVAGRIHAGEVVGWFQGRMEWGARALGNRSILADPTRADARDLINTRIKFRETFRPFAPSIAAESVGDYFVGDGGDPFMQQVLLVREDKRDVVPAVTHVDGTGRLQVVHSSSTPLYHSLIRAFEALSGVPILLNTSFNENEPIVESPKQAVECFLRTDMDSVVINRTVISRRRSSP